MIDPLILVRGIHFAATVLAAGTVCFMVLVVEPVARQIGGAAVAGYSTLRRRLTVLVWAALAAAILSGLTWLALIAADILDASLIEAGLQGGAWPVITGTRFGAVASARLALALLLGLLMCWPATRLLQLAAAAALIGLLAFVGHAGATPWPASALHLGSDLAHLLAASAWLGGLPALAVLLSWAPTGNEPAQGSLAAVAAKRFSLLGIASVGALLVSGLVNSWKLLAGPADLLTIVYGRILLLKIGLFAAMVAVAAVNRYRLTPRLPSSEAIRALQRNSLAEIGLGLGLLFMVGALGTIAPGAHMHSSTVEVTPEAAFIHIHTNVAMADVTINPGHTGVTKATVRLSHEDYSEFSAKYVRLALDPPAGGTTIERAAALLPDGTWEIAELDIPAPGIWTVRVVIGTNAAQPIVLDAPIVITQCSNEC